MHSLKLQILWLDDSLGLSVNQQTPKENFPLTPYYFWPISEAWNQIRFELESKPWISEKERVTLLNSVVDAMNQWQRSGTLSTGKIKVQDKNTAFNNITVVGLP